MYKIVTEKYPQTQILPVKTAHQRLLKHGFISEGIAG